MIKAQGYKECQNYSADLHLCKDYKNTIPYIDKAIHIFYKLHRKYLENPNSDNNDDILEKNLVLKTDEKIKKEAIFCLKNSIRNNLNF